MNKKNMLTVLFLLLGAGAFAQSITAKDKETILANIKKQMTEHYHFKDKLKLTLSYLDQQWASGRYNAMQTIPTFSEAVARDLKKAAGDEHLNLFYQGAELSQSETSNPGMNWGLINEKFLNNGLTGLQILPGDIGYIKLQAFGSFENILPSAFAFVSNTQALIIDLRGNGGGMPSNLVSSYLLPEDSIHLVTIYWNHRTDKFHTHRILSGPRYLDRPVYLLTDRGTFSSAEEFAYDLQALKRVTIVGEASGGGANPGGLMPVYQFGDGARLDLYVSLAHVENAITKTNWEGRGVQPDVVIDPKEALRKAHLLALEQLALKETNPLIRKRYEEIGKEAERR